MLIIYYLVYFLIRNCICNDRIISGIPIILDGDTIKINGIKIRLHGIDAPEKFQICNSIDMGLESINHLKKIIFNHTVKCFYTNKDQYNRILATCHIYDININKQMVRHGYAFAYKYFSRKYEEDEK